MRGNKEAFETTQSIQTYSASTSRGLFLSEHLAFSYLERCAQGSVLDIGVGAGRTTPYLARQFESYLGIDYSAPLIAAAKRLFPHQTFLVMDVRQLSIPSRFDCVVFSYNGLDYICQEERQDVLRRIGLLLHPGGIFIYSTHNVDYKRVPVWLSTFFVHELVCGRQTARLVVRRAKRFRLQKRFADYAYVNDPGFGFSLLTRYASVPTERDALATLGFCPLATIGQNKADATFDSDDSWVYLVAQKH